MIKKLNRKIFAVILTNVDTSVKSMSGYSSWFALHLKQPHTMHNSTCKKKFARKRESMNKIKATLEPRRKCVLWAHRKNKTVLTINCAWIKYLKFRWIKSKECRPLLSEKPESKKTLLTFASLYSSVIAKSTNIKQRFWRKQHSFDNVFHRFSEKSFGKGYFRAFISGWN